MLQLSGFPTVCGQSSSFLNFEAAQLISVATKPFMLPHNPFPQIFFYYFFFWSKEVKNQLFHSTSDFTKKSLLVANLHLDEVVCKIREKKTREKEKPTHLS